MLIKIPSSFEAWTLTWLIVISMFIGMVTVTYFYIRRKMKRKYLLSSPLLLAMIEKKSTYAYAYDFAHSQA